MVVFTDNLSKAKSYVKTSYDHSSSLFKEFGNGGAFPEIHFAQYPLGMGRSTNQKPYENVDENANKIVYFQHMDLVPIFVKDNIKDHDELDGHEKKKQIDETARNTKAALMKVLEKNPTQSFNYYKYIPNLSFNSGSKGRIIRVENMSVDVLEPPKFKHKRVPKAYGSTPVPVMHSPPRPVTMKDQQDWNIPPCISRWKNSKGYTIQLDKRLADHGRGLEEDVKINDNFAKLAEALNVNEQKAREAVEIRSKVQKEIMIKDKENKELELIELARKAISERTGIKETKEDIEEYLHREKIRKDKKRERRQGAKEEAAGVMKNRKVTRDGDRCISEKVALGMASTGGNWGEVMYDQRLFNQEKRMDSGFADDDAYNIYGNSLLTAQNTMCTLYRPKKDANEQLKEDPFELDQFFTGMKTGRKK